MENPSAVLDIALWTIGKRTWGNRIPHVLANPLQRNCGPVSLPEISPVNEPLLSANVGMAVCSSVARLMLVGAKDCPAAPTEVEISEFNGTINWSFGSVVAVDVIAAEGDALLMSKILWVSVDEPPVGQVHPQLHVTLVQSTVISLRLGFGSFAKLHTSTGRILPRSKELPCKYSFSNLVKRPSSEGNVPVK